MSDEWNRARDSSGRVPLVAGAARRQPSFTRCPDLAPRRRDLHAAVTFVCSNSDSKINRDCAHRGAAAATLPLWGYLPAAKLVQCLVLASIGPAAGQGLLRGFPLSAGRKSRTRHRGNSARPCFCRSGGSRHDLPPPAGSRTGLPDHRVPPRVVRGFSVQQVQQDSRLGLEEQIAERLCQRNGARAALPAQPFVPSGMGSLALASRPREARGAPSADRLLTRLSPIPLTRPSNRLCLTSSRRPLLT